VIVAAAVLGAALLAADLAVDAFQPAVKTFTAAPFCGTGHAMIARFNDKAMLVTQPSLA